MLHFITLYLKKKERKKERKRERKRGREEPRKQEKKQTNKVKNITPYGLNSSYQVQGAIVVGCLFEVVLGYFGIVGVLCKHLGPLTIACTIFLVGFSLIDVAVKYCATHMGIAVL